MPDSQTVGITTTVPIEVLIAAGYRPLDLNNLFITDPDPGRLVNLAERAGFPLTCCTWIKGIFGVCLDRQIQSVLGVTAGDCSNTLMLMEVLDARGVEVVPFAYPSRPEEALVEGALVELARRLSTDLTAAEAVRRTLEIPRELARQVDALTWEAGQISGWENHLWLVSTSDFNGAIPRYCQDTEGLIATAQKRTPYPAEFVRLAFCGVPPIFAADLYRFVEFLGGRVVFNEVQRQFSMPYASRSLAEQYARYTYPYQTRYHLMDITAELTRRRVDAVIHYVQAFCHQEIGDILFRQAIGLPILTLQGNDLFSLNESQRTRLEAFVDMVRRRQTRPKSDQGQHK